MEKEELKDIVEATEEGFEREWDTPEGDMDAPDGEEYPQETPDDGNIYEETREWAVEGESARRPLGERLFSPMTDSFDSLDNRQKGIYILAIGIVAVLVGTGLLISLIIKLS